MTIDFSKLNNAQVRSLLGIGSKQSSKTVVSIGRGREFDVAANIEFMKGDYFQNGKQGAFPGSITNFQVLEDIRREFATLPALDTIVLTHRRGVVGHEPSWTYALRRALRTGDDGQVELPVAEEQKDIDDSNAAVTSFWERRKIHKLAQDFTDNYDVTGEIALHLFVQRNATAGDTVERKADLESALKVTHAEVLPFGTVCEYVDRDTMRRALGYEFQEKVLNEKGDLAETRTRLLLTYLDDNNLTVVRSWTDDKEDTPSDPLDLNGELLIYLVKGKPLITRALRDLQNQISKTITMMGNNNNLAGFLKLIAIGLMPPGDWIKDDRADTGYVFKPKGEAPTGPAQMNFLQTQMVWDQTAQGYKFPPSTSITKIDPIDPDYLIKSSEYLYRCMLRNASQEHTLISGDATASGVSRIESRAQFLWSLLEAKVVVEEVLRWLLETALLLAVNLTVERTAGAEGEANAISPAGVEVLNRFKALRARVDVHASAGPISPEERLALVTQFQAGGMSIEELVTSTGIEDDTAELNRMAADPNAKLELLEKQAAVFAAWSAVLPAEDAMLIATGAKTPMEVLKASNFKAGGEHGSDSAGSAAA